MRRVAYDSKALRDPPSPIGTGTPNDLEVGDFVGDNRLDVAGASGSTVTIYRQSDGGFETETLTSSASVSSMAIADFNSDGGNDLAVASGGTPGRIHVYSQNAVGELGFTTGRIDTEGMKPGPSSGS